MANYSLVIDSTFKPFTYQELAAPIMEMSNYHEKLNEEYDRLSSQADVLEAMGANDRDKGSGSYSKYKAYSDRLRKEADDLYRFGLNTESRQRLSDLRRMYNTDIVPIQNAWTKREKEADDQMKAQLANPSLMFTRDARNTTLDDYVRNPTGGYGIINGANITKQMSDMAGQLAKQVRSGKKENIDPYTYNYIQKFGLDENLIRNWQDSPTLKAMFEQVMRANGVTEESLQGSNNLNDIISKSTNYAEIGMWNAMGEDKTQIQEEYIARLNAQAAKELSVYRRKKEIDQEYAPPTGDNGDGTFGGTMTDSIVQLPMAGADNSHNRENQDALITLGYRDNGKQLKYNGKVNIKYGLDKSEVDAYNQQKEDEMAALQKKVDSGTATIIDINRLSTMARMKGRYGNFKSDVGASTTKEASLYDSRGRILSREQFVAQAGNSEKAKKAFNDYYNKVEAAEKTLGIASTNYTHTDLTNHYNTLRDNNAAQMANVMALNYNKDDWNPTSKRFRAKRIERYKGGNPVFNSESISLEELLEKYPGATPYWGRAGGQEGLIFGISENGKDLRYFIPADNMNESNIQRARTAFRDADIFMESGDNNAARNALEVGYRALNSGLTLNNQKQTQTLNRQPTLKQQGFLESE